MPERNIIVIGGSAGSIEVLKDLVAELPSTLSAALFITVHVSADSPGMLGEILDRAGPLPAHLAEDRAPIQKGHIYVAPPDYHLLLEAGWMRLTHGPKENRSRPAIDPLFRSAAYAFGPQVIGVVLSGMLDDGTAGLWAIKDRGGIAIVQEPSDALYSSMPQSALRYVSVDYRLGVKEMAALLQQLVYEPVAETEERPMPEALAIETGIALGDHALRSGILHLGEPSLFTCPECHGVLIQIEEGGIVRFRCHTGHAYSQQTLLAEVDEAIELTLWSTIRTIDEKALLLHQMAQQLSATQENDLAQQLIRKANEVEQRSQRIRELVLRDSLTKLDEPEKVDPRAS